MIKKIKIGLFVVVLSLVFIGGVNYAKATSDVTLSVDTNYNIGGAIYTALAGSEATSIVINTASTTLTVVVPASKVFTLTSASGYDLVPDQVTTVETCSGNLSTAAYTDSGAGSTLVFTPTTTKICGSNGSGTGGGTPADTTPPTNTSVSISAGATTTTLLAATLTLAATGASQMMISNDSAFTGGTWETYATSKAWTLTSGDGLKTVYAKFKDAAGNISTAVSDTITVSGSGTVEVAPTLPAGCLAGYKFSPTTGAACPATPATPVVPGINPTTPATPASPALYNFGTKTLKNGSTGEAVKELQRFLNATLNLGLVVDGKLGPKTIAVIKKWQKANSLVADGLIGTKTKAKMNASVQ